MRILALTLIICLQGAQALAGGSIGLGYFTGVSPYRDYDRNGTLFPLIHYENEHFYFRGLSLGLKAYEGYDTELSVFLAYNPHKFKASDSSYHRLRRLRDRDDSFMAGGRLSIDKPIGKLGAELAVDVTGHNEGLLGQLRYGYPLELDQLTITPEAGFYWASEKYNNYYYGVSRKEAAVSGLPFYQADAAAYPFGALKADLPLGKEGRLGIFAAAEVVFLPSTIKNSPMVGRSNTYSFGTGARYSFF